MIVPISDLQTCINQAREQIKELRAFKAALVADKKFDEMLEASQLIDKYKGFIKQAEEELHKLIKHDAVI